MEANTAGSNSGMDCCPAEKASAHYLKLLHGRATSGTALPCPAYRGLVSLVKVSVCYSASPPVSTNFEMMRRHALAEAVMKEEGIQVKRMISARSMEEGTSCMVVAPYLVPSPHV